jgi:iron complex outermembrane receptor protein
LRTATPSPERLLPERLLSPLASLLTVVLAAGLLAAAPRPGYAQAPPADTSEIAMRVQMADSVVVTASRLPQLARQTGRRVTVWTQQDLQDLAITSIDQLLEVAGGLDVQSRGGFGVQSDLTMRGSTFNGVLLLLDGARINDPMTGHFLMDLPVPLSEIARVEILRGPATALYGPDALGGVVHLITKTGLRTGEAPEAGLAAAVEGQYGGDDLYDGTVSARRVGDRTTVSAAATAQGSDGQPITGEDGSRVRRAGDPVSTDFTRRAATAAVSHTFADALGGATLYARAGLDDRSFSAWHFYTSFDSDKAREETSTYWMQARLQGESGGETSWRAQVSAKQHDDRYDYNPNVAANVHTSELVTAQAQASRDYGPLTVTGGGSGHVRAIDSNGLGEHSDVAGGGFVRLTWRATPRLTLNQSTRVDADPTYGVEPTPQLYASYTLDRVTLRAGVGRAVRAPNYVERYVSYGGNRGTPDLNAETSWSGEAGLDVRAAPGVSLHATGFHRRTRDLIDYALPSSDAEVFTALNLHRVRTTGLELEGRLARSLGRNRVRLTSTYTFLDATLEEQRSVLDYKYALTSARHLLQGSAAVTRGGVTVGLQGLWKDRLAAPSGATDRYGVIHGRVGYTADVAGQRLTLSVEARNLLDREYSEVFDAPMPRRTFTIGARLDL